MSVAYGQQAKLTFGPQKEHRGATVDNIVAVVGNDVITRKELKYRKGTQRRKELESLIMRKLLLQEAAKHNIVVSDTAVNMVNKGKKSTSRQRAREDLIIANLQQKVVSSLVSISDREVNDLVERQLKSSSDQVRLVDILISPSKSSDSKTLNQAQVKTQEIIGKLAKLPPQRVAAQYSSVSYNDLGWVKLANIPPMFSRVLVDAPVNQYTAPITDQDGTHILKILAKKQRKGKNKTSNIPQTRVAHILITDKGNTAKAEKTIKVLYAKLKKGASFAQLAKQHSQDPGSATKGGDLGWTLPGKMVPEFENIMNRTKTGSISQPFKTRFGYHILRVDGRRKAPTNNRNALVQQVKQSLFRKKAAEEWALWLSQLREESYVEIRQP